MNWYEVKIIFSGKAHAENIQLQESELNRLKEELKTRANLSVHEYTGRESVSVITDKPVTEETPWRWKDVYVPATIMFNLYEVSAIRYREYVEGEDES